MSARATTTLYLGTDLSGFVREGEKFPDLPEPYTRILSIALQPEATTTHKLILPIKLAGRLITYHNEYYDGKGEPTDEISCAHFVRYLCGQLDPDWQTSMFALDGAAGVITTPRELPPYHLGVIASSQAFNDRVGFTQFLHGGIGLDGEWKGHLLNISGLKGYLAISSAQILLDYHREHIQSWYNRDPAIEPSNLQLYDRGEAIAGNP